MIITIVYSQLILQNLNYQEKILLYLYMQGLFLAFFVPLSKSIFPSDVIFLLPEGFPLTFLEGMSNDDKCFQQFCLKTSSFYLNFISYFH